MAENTALGTESSLSNWAGPYVTEMLGRGRGLSEQQYDPYMGPLTAGTNQLQDQAFSGIAGLTLSDPTNQAAQGYDNVGGNFDFNRWNGDWAEQYMNPYVDQALQPQLDEVRRQSEIERINNAGRMTQAGSFGGGRQAIMESEMDDNMLRLMGELTGEGYRNAYDTAFSGFTSDEGRRLDTQKAESDVGLQALRQQGELGSQMTRDQMGIYDQLLGAGDTRRDILQQGMDADKAQFEEERMWPYEQVQFMQSLLQKMPLEAQNKYSTGSSQFQDFASGASGIGSILSSLGLGSDDGFLGGIFSGEDGMSEQDRITQGFSTLEDMGIL